MGKRIVEKYKLNDETIEIVSTPSGYDVIYRRDNITRHIMQNVDLSSAYAYVAGFMYNRYWNDVNNKNSGTNRN